MDSGSAPPGPVPSKDLPEIDTMNLTYMHLSAEGRKDIEIRMNENLLDEELTFGVNLYS